MLCCPVLLLSTLRHMSKQKMERKYKGYVFTLVGVKGLLMMAIFAMCIIWI